MSSYERIHGLINYINKLLQCTVKNTQVSVLRMISSNLLYIVRILTRRELSKSLFAYRLQYALRSTNREADWSSLHVNKNVIRSLPVPDLAACLFSLALHYTLHHRAHFNCCPAVVSSLVRVYCMFKTSKLKKKTIVYNFLVNCQRDGFKQLSYYM